MSSTGTAGRGQVRSPAPGQNPAAPWSSLPWLSFGFRGCYAKGHCRHSHRRALLENHSVGNGTDGTDGSRKRKHRMILATVALAEGFHVDIATVHLDHMYAVQASRTALRVFPSSTASVPLPFPPP